MIEPRGPRDGLRLVVARATGGQMTENVRYVAGHMELTDQLLEASREVEAAIERHRQRMESDPEYAAKYRRELAERLDRDPWNRLYEVAEDASNGELSIEDAIQAVRDGYASAEADRELRDHPEDL